MIIGISGPRGSGKDLLATCLRPYGFTNLQLAGPLKEMVRRDYGLTAEQTDGALKESPTQYVRKEKGYWTPRDIMIREGTVKRSIDAGYWVNRLFQQMAPKGMYTVSDVRFVNECMRLKEKGAVLVRLERDPALNIYKAALDDLSETELNAYDGFDFKLEAYLNRTPSDLKQFADYIVAHLSGSGRSFAPYLASDTADSVTDR